MEYVTAIAMLALIQYTWFGIEVGLARGRFEVPAPATTGNDRFDRYFRAHQNTSEQLVVFLPAMYGCAFYASEMLAASLGLVFVIGRGLYFRGYTDPEKSRGLGFGLGMLASLALVLTTLFSIGMALLG